MTGVAYHRIAQSVRQLTVWCLLVSLPIYGLSATLVAMLGTSHTHTQVAAAASALDHWSDFRRINHAADGAPHAHSHFGLQRHHHAPGDSSVVSLDGSPLDTASADGSAAATGSASLVFALASRLEIPEPNTTSIDWAALVPSPIKSRAPERLERPPKA